MLWILIIIMIIIIHKQIKQMVAFVRIFVFCRVILIPPNMELIELANSSLNREKKFPNALFVVRG